MKRLICSLVYSRVDTLAAEQTGRNHSKKVNGETGEVVFFFVSPGFRFPLFTLSKAVSGEWKLFRGIYSVNGK